MKGTIQRLCDVGEVVDVLAEEGAEAQEGVEVLALRRFCVVADCSDVLRERVTHCAVNHVAQELDLVAGQITLGRLEVKAGLANAGVELAEVIEVLAIRAAREHHRVVDVDRHGLPEEIGEHTVHKALHGGARVAEAEGHDAETVGAAFCGECCLEIRAVTCAHRRLPVPRGQVMRGEPRAAFRRIEDRLDAWERVAIARGDFADLGVVDAETP